MKICIYGNREVQLITYGCIDVNVGNVGFLLNIGRMDGVFILMVKKAQISIRECLVIPNVKKGGRNWGNIGFIIEHSSLK